MVFLRVTEPYGGTQIVNMDKVERITDAGAGQAKFWFSSDDVDTMLVQESFKEIEKMLDVALTGYPRVVDKKAMEMVTSLPPALRNGMKGGLKSNGY
ncbi:hypothetical protein BN1080_02107 [Planococcus massiliensis]|uniref:Uncharacterized protein n=1 Tax=Planococcus massiliensis TaxID=1499687 RepID=A0A098ELJ6_9BACL|nr:hypothetical protein [Planococcus massiliensis]CEG23163.1 hypothetical protein BN1080_02107 [Planococcus massiliensis]